MGGEAMKKLCLVHPLDSQTEFVEGVNCEKLMALDNGSFMIIRGEREDTVPAHRVLVFTQEPRHGLTPEPELRGEAGLPKWVKLLPEGGSRPWGCTACTYASETIHGVKVHHGMTHGAG